MSASTIKSIFRPFKRLAGKILRYDRINARINDLANQLAAAVNEAANRQQSQTSREAVINQLVNLLHYQGEKASFPIPPWYDQNLCEPTVQIVLRDLCRPGDTVFDVGANAGALSVLMSRLVGLRGTVCSFEASRRIVDKTQNNLVVNGCSNVQLYNRAIYHTTGKTVVIYYGTHLNDSIVECNDYGKGKSETETLSLDDFIAWTGHEPTVIKMDIEGAEYDALCGAEKLIDRVHPALLLEQQSHDMRCIDMLRAKGYIAIDLSTYRVIESSADYQPGVIIANVLCLHESKIAATPYSPPFRQTQVAELSRADFRADKAGWLEAPLSIKKPGRFIFDFDFSADGTNNEVHMGVDRGEKTLIRYHAYSRLLASDYRQMPLHLSRGSDLTVFFRFLNGTKDPTFQLRKVSVSRIENFDGVAGPLVD